MSSGGFGRVGRAAMRAGLSIDLDDLWTYRKSRGEPDWQARPSFLELAVPRALDFLARHGLRATFFVVGCDAERPEHGVVLRQVVDAGHEIGNHSYAHELRFDLFDPVQLDDDIGRAEAAIAALGAAPPVGFRAPGHSISPAALEVLERRGYVYDASPWPTFVLPLIRRLYLHGVRLTAADRRQRREAARGAWRGRWSNRPHVAGVGSLVVLPVTTLPGLRLPIHLTYVNALHARSAPLARRYVAGAVALCRYAGTPPSVLLHLTDFLGSDDPVDLSFIPGMRQPHARKLELLDHTVAALERHFQVVPLIDLARSVRESEMAARHGPLPGRPSITG